MKIYNTLSGKKEIFKISKKKTVKIFVCGPTVYDLPHIGNARTYVVFDAFVKYLRLFGYSVNYLQNITDIDDKIIDRAKKEKISPKDLADKYEKIYHHDEKTIGITAVNNYFRATNSINQIIKQIKILIKKSFVYKIENDGYYFDISKFSDYGKLSKRTVLQAENAISRIDKSINKINKGDFVVWKFSNINELGWNSSLGFGRPGWHIEDTAITNFFFGPQYDIHGGAEDLKFPHHEAEIAQQEGASGKKPMVKIWMHVGFLLVNGKKMSKSLKNFITIQDFLKKYPKEVLRLLLLSTHYRSPINCTPKLIDQMAKNIDSIADFQEQLINFKEIKNKLSLTKSSKKNQKNIDLKIKKYQELFFQELNNDFNTARAIAVIFRLPREFNDLLNKNFLNKKSVKAIKDFIATANKILGIIPKIKKTIIPSRIKELIKAREEFRKNSQWKEADKIREKIKKLGFMIEDTKKGPMIKKLKVF